MIPQNLDALFSALSGPPGAGGGRPEGFAGEDGVAAWAEALAMFESGSETPGALESTLLEDNAAALDWLGQLGELNDLVDQAVDGELPVGEELLAQLQALLGLLEESMPEASAPTLIADLQDQIRDSLARLQEGMAGLLKQSTATETALDAAPGAGISERLQDSMRILQRMSDQMAKLSTPRSPDGASALQALAALGQSTQRAAGREEGLQNRPEPAMPAGREATLARLAEMSTAAREGSDGGPLARGMPEITRAVLLSQQLHNAGGGQALQADNGSLTARADNNATPLTPAAAAPAREPALPPTAQLLGQPAASAGEMRAAAEQAMQRVVWMAAREQGVSQARLQLHPEHLGKVDVRLEVQGREANVVLNVQNGPVREAMEAMLPRLRDQLEQQGINLGDASVFDSEPEDATPDDRRGGLAGGAAEGGEVEADELPVQVELNLRGRGLLDAYA